MEKGNLIGEGKTAEVYEWDKDKVLKLYFKRFSMERPKHEAKVGNIVHNAGLPSPRVYDIIEVDNRKGLVLEYIHGSPIWKHIETEPWKLYSYAEKLAKLHSTIHKVREPNLPSQKERFTLKLEHAYEILGPDKTNRILDYIDTLPDGCNVCHGDLHFNNVISTDNGLVPIDWANAYRGNPFGDVARTCLLMNTPLISSKVLNGKGNILDPRWLAYKVYLKEYLKLSKASPESVDAWILPLAAAKLKDKVTLEQKSLIKLINDRLKLMEK